MDYHISSGMFGSILVEPEDGLPEVDNEFYLGQHEIYTAGEVGEEGHHTFDHDAMMREEPTYVVFNGQAYGFTEDGVGPMQTNTGETARVYFANGGPNLLSSFHPIGNVWSDLYRDGDLLSEPANNVETTPSHRAPPPPARWSSPSQDRSKLVDHALSRVVHRGALGVANVQGAENPDVYDEDP